MENLVFKLTTANTPFWLPFMKILGVKIRNSEKLKKPRVVAHI